ncbi:hypothetical protein ER308_10415 [Egibacter rhizosphaerae]|uniref:Oxidoreductase n=1 Tax=Egibacter rhizosphaerae TaxID=1670831 RepID=A0A411YFB2_9ACTN|nr:Gfo/Idh/MocA family oxidoreductase [Egibacter rhizosphaerae]QBI19933.1 hypothetical protein ER308_10415 [Egibacter rhizosphaerae]
MENSGLRVVLAGAGRAGMVHGRNLAGRVPGARLVGVADADADTAEAAARELGCERWWDEPAKAVADEGVDAVVIASPTFTHVDIAVTALDAGRHVLCEKPLAPTLADARRIKEAAERSSAAFVMAFMRRYSPNVSAAKRAIEAGDIGRPLFARSTTRGPGLPPEWAWDPERSAGLIAEVNSHDLDSVRWFVGQEYVRVHAVGRAAKRPDLAARYPNFVDLIAATYEFDEGGIAQVDGACPADYAYDARLEVYGTEGALFVGDAREQGAALVVRSDAARSEPAQSWRTVFAAGYLGEDEHFVRVAAGIQEPGTTVDDGIRALEAALATNRSAELGRPVAIAEL